MIADAKLTGSIAKGISIAHYMLNPDAKINDVDIKKMQKEGGSERILHIETRHAHPVLISDSPKTAAASFIHGVVAWNERNRPGKQAPKFNWEHRVVSFHPSDSQKLNARTACKIAKESLEMVAPGQRPSLFVVHGDREHLHVHMLYATVNEKGKIFNLHQDYRIWEQAMESLEIKHNLTRVLKRLACADNDPLRIPDGTNPGKAEFRMVQRTGEPSCKQRLRELINEAINECKSTAPTKQFSQFLTSLRSKKIGVSANIQSTNTVAGIRFHYGIFSNGGIKASALGKAYSWNQLAKRSGFEHNSPFNTTLLKLSDNRIKEWIQHDAGGRKCATQINANIQGSGSRKNSRQPTRTVAASSQQAHTLCPEFPVDYPEFLKEYIRAIVRAANAEAVRQQHYNRLLSQSIDAILKLLGSFQTRAIKNHLKTQPRNIQPSTRRTDENRFPP